MSVPSPVGHPLKRIRPEVTTIVKLTPQEHCLEAADVYIGLKLYTRAEPQSRFMVSKDRNTVDFVEDVVVPTGLIKIFDEALLNAVDAFVINSEREFPTTKITIVLDRANGVITITNDGSNFEICRTNHDSMAPGVGKAWQPELAFFHTQAGGNFNSKRVNARSSVAKTTGGKNGLGAKLMSIYSDWSRLEMCDGTNVYKQESRDSMNQILAPSIREKKGKPYLKFTFKPRLSFFYPRNDPSNPTHWCDNTMRAFVTRVYDVSGTTPMALKVYLGINSDKPKMVPIRHFKQFVKFYIPFEKAKPGEEEKKRERVKMVDWQTDRWHVVMILNPYGHAVNVSFVNNINTYRGGQHLRYIRNQITNKVKKRFGDLTTGQIRVIFEQNVMLFVNCRIEAPSFSSQSKAALNTGPKAFGSECILPDSFCSAITRLGIADRFKADVAARGLKTAARDIGASLHADVKDIPKSRDAIKAGGKSAKERAKCILFLVEGDSAMALAEIGFSKTVKTKAGVENIGAKYYGGLSLGGKMINPSDKKLVTVQVNKVFGFVCRMLNLNVNVKNPPRSSLRYGRIAIFTDQDPDGAHITGQIIFMLKYFWPKLLEETDFLATMITPIVVATRGPVKNPRSIVRFYESQTYDRWLKGVGAQSGWRIKYYKGLGTSSNKEGKYYFDNLGIHLKFFKPMKAKDASDAAIDMAYNKKLAKNRRDWLELYDPKRYLEYSTISRVPIQRFVDEELIHYSFYSNKRALVTVDDGLCPSVRKIMWVLLTRPTNKATKVQQLQGMIADATQYHHGADSLGGAMVRAAQFIVGVNNMNLLYPDGQFGTRGAGGSDAASTRYISTMLTSAATLVFRKEDHIILKPQIEEKQAIEPECLAPIIPYCLINPHGQPGTGYRQLIPGHSPLALIEVIEHMIRGEPWTMPPPFFQGFTGRLVSDKYKFTSYGIVTMIGPTRYEITELPVGVWTAVYKFGVLLPNNGPKGTVKRNFVASKIHNIDEYHTQTTVHFVITLKEPLGPDVDPMQFFQLSSSKTYQLNFFPSNSTDVRIRQFDDREGVVRAFYTRRLEQYHSRCKAMVSLFEENIPYLNAQIRFVEAFVSGNLVLHQKRDILKAAMRNIGIDDVHHSALLDKSIRSLTAEKVAVLRKKIAENKNKITYFSTVDPKEIWMSELADLKSHLPGFLAEQTELQCVDAE